MRSMRAAVILALGLLVLPLSGCATSNWSTSGSSIREVEMAYDDGHPKERPILPSGGFELLIKNEPNIPSYKLLRVRFLVAQPGRLVLHLYSTGKDGRPEKVLYTISGDYGAQLTSNGSDGKWVVEMLPADLPPVQGTLWVGIGVPDPSSEARIWASRNDSEHVYQRDEEPQTALISAPVHYTPMVRVSLQPVQ